MLRHVSKRALSLTGYPIQSRLDTFPLRTSPHVPQNDDRSKGCEQTEISDQEWEMRTGRAIYVLRQTYPHFFETGLVSSLPADQEWRGTRAEEREPESADAQQSIYSPNIRLSYTPPLSVSLPLHIDGIRLYYVSAVFVRHTMRTLYRDLSVEIKRISVNSSSSGSPLSSSSLPGGRETTEEGQKPDALKARHRREKSVFMAMTVTGISRVSGLPGVWDVASTYRFSPKTALIAYHDVNSIHPAPHESVYEALRGVLLGRTSPLEKGAYDLGVGRLERIPVRVHAGISSRA